MKFIDPHPYTCPACGHEGSKTVKELLSGKAVCDACPASLSSIGKQMNEKVDENSAFHDAISLLMRIESSLGIDIPDEAIEKVRPWKQVRWLTIREIAVSVHTIADAASFSSIVDVVVSAIKEEFPQCVAEFDIDTPLLDVIKRAGGDA
jgi:transcription elongation factor Elf1